jgi:hypothetical protein
MESGSTSSRKDKKKSSSSVSKKKLRKAFEGPTKIDLNEIQLGEKLVCFLGGVWW